MASHIDRRFHGDGERHITDKEPGHQRWGIPGEDTEGTPEMAVEPPPQYGTAFIESQTPAIRTRISDLLDLQKQHADLMIKYQEEELELKKKYLGLCRPLFKSRRAIIIQNGQHGRRRLAGVSTEKNHAIPGFWLRVLKNHPGISKHIRRDDEDLLQHLVDIRLEYLGEGRNGFTLEFEFDNNPHILNRTLRKTFTYNRAGHSENIAEDVYGHELTFGSMEGEEIHWTTGKKATTDGTAPEPSFFNFFRVPTMETVKSLLAADADNSQSSEEEESFDDEAMENMYEYILDSHYQLGEIFKDQLIPNAVHWYTGEATMYEDADSSSYDEEEEEEGEWGDDDGYYQDPEYDDD